MDPFVASTVAQEDGALDAATVFTPGDGSQNVRFSVAQWSKLSETYLALSITVLALGFLGNVWVLYAGLSRKKLRDSSFYILLLNHTVLNLLLGVFIYPSLVFRLRVGLPRNSFEKRLCDYSSVCMLWFISVGLLTNGSMGINRALSCYPQLMVSSAIRAKKSAWAILAASWAFCFVVYVTTATLHPASWSDVFMCTRPEEIYRRASLGRSLVELEPVADLIADELVSLMIIALAVSVASYFVIGRYLASQGAAVSTQRRREKKRALLVIVLVFVAFLVCWVPLLQALMEDPYIVSEQHVYIFLAMVDTAVNPLLYVITMSAFRPHWWSQLTAKVSAQGKTDSVTERRDVGQSQVQTVETSIQKHGSRTAGCSR